MTKCLHISEKSSNFAGAFVCGVLRSPFGGRVEAVRREYRAEKMMKGKNLRHRLILVAAMLLLSVSAVRPEQLPYLCDFGLQGGIGYYIGDAQKHLFMYPREVYGVQFRYKFNNRWSIQVKGQYQKIDFKVDSAVLVVADQHLMNDMINIDAVGEFNFFRYGEKSLDPRIKPVTPYIFWGLGMTFSNKGLNRFNEFAMYFPFGIGVKWRFAPRWQLIGSWQHNLYFGDRLENVDEFGNTYDLNGSNIMNNDLTGQLTVGVVFEFAQQKSACKTCRWN